MADDTITWELVSRKDAKARGLKFYFTGKACKHGHVDKRSLCNGECVACARLRWKLDTEEKKIVARRNSARWRARHPDKAKEQVARWRANNPEKAKTLLKKWRAENPQRVREHAARVIRKNPQKNRDRMAAWVKANPELHRANGRNRRARELKAEGRHTAQEVDNLYRRQKGRCAYCRKPMGQAYCVDHIVPLVKGGSNRLSNIQLACRQCNSRKHAKDPLRFAREMGFLL